jgi:hypothetical protein
MPPYNVVPRIEQLEPCALLINREMLQMHPKQRQMLEIPQNERISKNLNVSTLM